MSQGKWTRPPHLNLLSTRLREVAFGHRGRRLIGAVPPQNGKSSLASHYFPVWLLELFPDRRIILTSYGDEYAAEWGRAVRNTIAEHQNVLTVRLSDDSTAADKWTTTAGGGMTCAGVGGSLTGRRADVLIFDDPYKNAEEANSRGRRERVWEFFKSTAYTRLTPDGVIVVIMTRWHPDDLVGRLIKESEDGTGERWEYLCLPAIAETDNDPLGRKIGEALWPQRWPLASLDKIRQSLGSHRWASLYQQHPTDPEGNLFKRAWFGDPVDTVPPLARTIRAWDLAATEQSRGNDPDYTAGVKVGLAYDGTAYVLNVVRLRDTPQNVERTIRQTALVDGPAVGIRIEQEPGASGKTLISHYQSKVLFGYDCRGVPPRGDKVTRAMPFSAACERGAVRMLRGPWLPDFTDELCSFPTVAHDDQVDAAVSAYEGLTLVAPMLSGYVGAV